MRTIISKTIAKFKNHEADILLGTQMIAKGHDFPLVTLVGVILADIGLNLPNYRSSERSFQLITQAIGRAGRKDRTGMAIIQTYAPNHYAITMAARQDYDMFFKTEMRMRQLQIYPPYCYLIAVNFLSKKEEDVISESLLFSEELKCRLGDRVTILGPVTPFVPYENAQYLRVLLLKYRDNDVKNELKNLLDEHIIKANVNIQINVDPYNY